MLEIPVSFLADEYGLGRRRHRRGLRVQPSHRGNVGVRLPRRPLVDTLLKVGLVAVLLFVGWVLGRDALAELRSGAGNLSAAVATPWLLAVGVVLPAVLVVTVLTTFRVDAGLGFWPTVLVAVGAAAVAGLRTQRALP